MKSLKKLLKSTPEMSKGEELPQETATRYTLTEDWQRMQQHLDWMRHPSWQNMLIHWSQAVL